MTITYGATGGGGPGATATRPPARRPGRRSSVVHGGTLTNLGASPSITVNAADGSGTLTTPTTTSPPRQTGRTLTFTYTAATGGMSNGGVTRRRPGRLERALD